MLSVFVFSLPTQPIWDAMSVMSSLQSEMATKGTGKGGLESQVQEYGRRKMNFGI